ncbi:MAG: rhodanese-like domain-containing protein, partial [Verrucomicrobiia bacterium]
MKKVIAVLTMALFASGVYAGEFPDISIAELKEAINAKTVTVIDVNGTDSWKEGHIPGAINFSSTKGKLAKLLPKDKSALVVAYCGGPSCGAYA